MKRLLFLLSCILFNIALIAQDEKLEVEGAIQIGNSEDLVPDAGTIRWTGVDFEGWDGTSWNSLTNDLRSFDGLTGKVYDLDGNVYNTVMIGGKQWMAENLKVTQLNDGTIIPEIIDQTVWSSLTSEGWCYYNNDSNLNDTHGKLYNWYAVDTGKLCPESWHVPSHFEWKELVRTMGYGTLIGGKMKTVGTINDGTGLWHYPNSGATNQTGFSAVPSGYRSTNMYAYFGGIDRRVHYWSSTQSDVYADRAQAVFLILLTPYLIVNSDDFHRTGISVRCLKDD